MWWLDDILECFFRWLIIIIFAFLFMLGSYACGLGVYFFIIDFL
jgi:hypothetical protein